MAVEAILAVFIALVCVAIMIMIKVLDDKIIELYALINNLNDWVAHHNKLTKRLLKDLEATHYSNIKPEVSD